MKIIFRRKLVTHRNTQMRLASVCLMWFVVFVVFFAFVFFVTFSNVSSRTEGMRIHDELVTKMLLVDQAKDLAFYYGLATVGYIILVWAHLLVYSHRLTGPIYKMTMILDKAAQEKSWPAPVKFRKSDAFSDLAESFNQFVDTMKSSKRSGKKSNEEKSELLKPLTRRAKR